MSRRWGFICACVVRHSCVFSLSANLRLPSRRFAARHPAFLADTRRTGCFSTPLRGAASLPMFHLPPGDVMSVLRGARACGAASLPVFTRLRRASHLSLSGHCAAGAARTAQLARRAKGRMPGVKKVTKRKATPMQRSPGSCPATARSGSGGWLTVHPLTGSQLARIPASHPAGLSCATSPLHRGPTHCASCAAKKKQRQSKAVATA